MNNSAISAAFFRYCWGVNRRGRRLSCNTPAVIDADADFVGIEFFGGDEFDPVGGHQANPVGGRQPG